MAEKKSGQQSILIVDDELIVRESLTKWFRQDGYRVEAAEDANKALKMLTEGPWDLALLDIKMPGMSGLELQKRIREIDKNTVVIMITAFASVESAVQALKDGAFDYVTKPIDPDHLSHLVANALRQKKLQEENIQLREQMSDIAQGMDIVGDSQQIRKVVELAKTVAQTDTTVMLRGESGTGKELIARAIHANSGRRYFPIIAVNCGAVPESLLESELFGHEKGAFTGAQFRRKGKFELADGGTIFLDEIGTISQKMQVQLLRVIESKQLTRVGGNEVIHSDVRIICATNRDLEAAVKDGTFREDLYYRLNVFTVFIPPIRERRTDIPLLVQHFLKKYSAVMNKQVVEITPEAVDMLVRYDWPGNVRELENVIERSLVMCSGERLDAADIKLEMAPRGRAQADHFLPEGMSLDQYEQDLIREALRRADGNKSQAARLLGLTRNALRYRLTQMGLEA